MNLILRSVKKLEMEACKMRHRSGNKIDMSPEQARKLLEERSPDHRSSCYRESGASGGEKTRNTTWPSSFRCIKRSGICGAA